MAFVKSCQPVPRGQQGESSLEARTCTGRAVAPPRCLKLLTCLILACWLPLHLPLPGPMALTLPLKAQAQARSFVVPLQCRIETSAWRRCRMVVQQVGRQWSLELDSQRIEFRHDGDGRIRMLRDAMGWRQVDSYWDAEGGLCWGQVCAKGDIPLD